MKLHREEVYKILEDEAEYSKKWDIERSEYPDSLADKDKPVEVWLLWMEQYLADARKAATAGYDKSKALDRLRCVLNLGINCALYHGLPQRGKK